MKRFLILAGIIIAAAAVVFAVTQTRQKETSQPVPSSMPDDQAFNRLTDLGEKRPDQPLFDFIVKQMMTADGGIISQYNQKGTPDETILSETQGQMMFYAVQTDNREMFDKLLNFVKANLNPKGGLMSWRITNGSPDLSNAAIDDLRIIRAILAADKKWGGYQDFLKVYEDGLYQFNTQDDHLVDFYNVEPDEKASRLTLCYADFYTLELLSNENESWKAVYQNALKTVEDGHMKSHLYSNWYDYQNEKYVNDDMPMSEELVTFLHLAEIHELSEDSAEWLWDQIRKDSLYAVYSANGKVAKDGDYHSTAVYALAAQIALESEKWPEALLAFEKMDSIRITDSALQTYGAFGNPDGTGIYSYDQCTALLAYQKLNEVIEHYKR